MKPTDSLSRFVHDALAAGHDRQAIRQALVAAGWPVAAAEQALAGWETAAGMPPVPRPRAYLSAREGLVFGLLFLSLAVIGWHVCALGFELIDRLLPDGRQYFGSSSLRWSAATLLTFVPLFLFLDRRAGREQRQQAPGGRSLVRRWFASLGLLVAALLLLGDLVYTIHALLSGEMTLGFVLKALLVGIMSGLILAYYRDEMDV